MCCPDAKCSKELKLYPFIQKCYLCSARTVVIDSDKGNCPSCKTQIVAESNLIDKSSTNNNSVNGPVLPRVEPPVSPTKVAPIVDARNQRPEVLQEAQTKMENLKIKLPSAESSKQP